MALKDEFELESLFVKNDTVRGIIGKTHGVSRASKPPKKPKINKSR